MALDSTAREVVGASLTVNSGLMQTCSETRDKRRQRSVFGFHNTKSTVHELLFPSCFFFSVKNTAQLLKSTATIIISKKNGKFFFLVNIISTCN